LATFYYLIDQVVAITLKFYKNAVEMNEDHWILLGYWSLFSLLHHGMATEIFKARCRAVMGTGFKYYRLLYSLIAIFSLRFVLRLQLSISSSDLGISTWLKYLVGLPVGILGILIMGASIRKYFFNVSGIGVLFHNNSPGRLEFHGLNKYVRHPLYLGTMLFIWAIFIFIPLLSNLIASAVITIYIMVGIQFEERKLVLIFGQTYESYRLKTPRLLPNVRFPRILK
jgi:protein-S-isoprenylcysteine O-methyltransferase Ste14